MSFKRISVNPAIMMGKPCIKGTRITVELILENLGEGAAIEYLLKGYPDITKEDIFEAINYANAVARNRWKIDYNKRLRNSSKHNSN